MKRMLIPILCLTGLVHAELLTLPLNDRPEWLSREGIVMAGSWEPLLFRVRRDGGDGYTPTPEQEAAYQRERSPEMIARLRELGVNFVMAHCYKGAGLTAERRSMDEAVRFARLCHEAGLHVGVYVYSGAFLWEPLFQEVPQARDWVLLDREGNPPTYPGAPYRYRWNRNHPGAQAYYRRVIRFAVHDIEADLVHFDNYSIGAGHDPVSVRRFRQYLSDTFTAERLEEMGITDLEAVDPPAADRPYDLLDRAWLDFCCQSLAESYHDVSQYARELRRNVLVECNPGGPGSRIRPHTDHGRLLQGGEAFWDEGSPSGYRNGRLHTRIRTYKVGRRMDNVVFTYTTTPLEMAESMAFNLDCLGCLCWFEYGKIAARPGSTDLMSSTLEPFVKFFHARRDLLRDTEVVADVAVLRSFASQVFGDPSYANLTGRIEQALIDSRVCFHIIYNHHLNDLARYRVLVLAGCVAMSDRQIAQVERYVQSGGKLCIVGPVAAHNEWMLPRDVPSFDDLPSSRVIRVAENGDVIAAIRRLCDADLSLTIRGEPGLCSELTRQAGRHVLHLVNYRQDDPAEDVGVSIQLPVADQVERVTLTSPKRSEEIALPFEVQGRRVTFTVPKVDLYEIAVVKTKASSKEVMGSPGQR